MSLLQILTDPQNFRFYAGGRGHVSNAGSFGQKSIPYGDDTKGGGSSNQPYIKSPIPDELTSGNPDFLLRGGLLNNSQTSAQDVSRLTKMFLDTKSTNGLFFTLKQEQLSATAVRTQASPRPGLNGQLYDPLNTITQAGLLSIGTHLNKQGLNPAAETGAYANGNERLYGVVVTNKQEPEDNRLWQLMNGRLIRNNAQGPDDAFIMRYNGGPGSFKGAGRTVIRFGKDSKTFLSLQRTNDIPSVYDQNTWVYNSYLIRNTDAITSLEDDPEGEQFPINNKVTYGSPTIQDFRKILRANLVSAKDKQDASNSGATPDTPNYQRKNYEQNFNFTDPGQRAGKSYASYTNGVINLSNGKEVGAVDKINAAAIYQSEKVSDSPEFNDFVSFRIAAINNNNPAQKNFIHFRALLDSFSDNYNAEWGDIRYLGRGEKFYNYNGFTREVNLTFTAAAQSKQELIPMYTKLNYLASQLMPDYSGQGYMRGALVQLTVGGYLYEQPGFITNLAYDLINDAPWEIAIDTEGNPDPTVKQLSHMVKVTSFTFVPIHTFAPRKQQLGFGSNNYVSSYGNERFIALQSTSDDSNYFVVQPQSITNVPAKNFNSINLTPPKPGNIRRTPLPPPLSNSTLPIQRTDFL